VPAVSRGIDRIDVTFDEPNLVANTGLVLVATLVVRLELERLINATVDLSGRVGGARPGRKVLTLVHALAAGGSHIDHADVLRSGATGSVLGHRVMAPSTVGTFLRSFTFGDVRQLDAVLGEALHPAWGLGAGPRSEPLVIDLDSTIREVCGKTKAGAGYGYTKVLGYHPLVAVRAGTGEVLQVRMRNGQANTQRGAVRFVEELVARVRRAGASGELIMRFDSGFWSNATIATLERLEVGFTMGVRMVKSVVTAVEGIDEAAWTAIDYTANGEAEVAECDYRGRRLIVRRTRLTGRQATLWPSGDTLPSSPTSKMTLSMSMPFTALTPRSNWPSAT
jgi:Transposase DDE domain group 1